MKHIGPWDDRAISSDAFFGGVDDHQGLQYGWAIPSTKVIVQLVEELFVAICVSVRQRLHDLQLHLLAELLVGMAEMTLLDFFEDPGCQQSVGAAFLDLRYGFFHDRLGLCRF